MRISVEKLTKEALALPVDARALLAEKLAESLDPFLKEGVRAVWVAEALRQRDEVREISVKPVPAEVLLTQVRKRLNK
jgi:hypothetical protein